MMCQLRRDELPQNHLMTEIHVQVTVKSIRIIILYYGLFCTVESKGFDQLYIPHTIMLYGHSSLRTILYMYL